MNLRVRLKKNDINVLYVEEVLEQVRLHWEAGNSFPERVFLNRRDFWMLWSETRAAYGYMEGDVCGNGSVVVKSPAGLVRIYPDPMWPACP